VRSSQASSSAPAQVGLEIFEQVFLVERRGEPYLRLALSIVQVNGDDELLARNRFRGREQRATSVAQLVARFAARAPPTHAIWIGQA
jgi:hypothetical protein